MTPAGSKYYPFEPNAVISASRGTASRCTGSDGTIAFDPGGGTLAEAATGDSTGVLLVQPEKPESFREPRSCRRVPPGSPSSPRGVMSLSEIRSSDHQLSLVAPKVQD